MNLRLSLFSLCLALITPATLHAQFSDGVLDTSFDGDGIAQTDFGNGLEDQANAVAAQPDGKTVVAGYSLVAGKYQVALARYTMAGALDTTFGTNGRVLHDVGPDHDAAQAVAVQPDGKIVIAGYTYGSSSFEFLVMRFTANGSVDTTFGTNGKVTLALSSSVNIATSLALQSDGKIIVGGFASFAGPQDFVVLRYTDLGVLDPTFSGDGIAQTDLGGSTEQANAVAVQTDGKIVVAGFSSQGAWADTAMVRYTDTGTLDAGFGSGGKVITSRSALDDYAYALAITPSGEILLGGSAATGMGFTDGVITRYTSTGVYDAGFGAWITSSLGNSNVIRGLAVQSNGHIIYAGSTSDLGGRFILRRMAGNGGPDATFNPGVYQPAIGTGSSAGYAVVLHADGRIAVAGRSLSSAGGVDFTTLMFRSPRPDIAVAAGSALTDGIGTVSLGGAPAGSNSADFTFSITNPGNAELNNLAITKSGTDAEDFDVSALSGTSIPAGGGSVTFTVTFTPATGGAKTAALQIASNVSGTKNPFDIALTATALGTGQDSDNDGLNDLAEYQLAALGFNWQAAQTGLVQTYFATAAGAGLFKASEVQALRLPTPQIQRDPLTGEFTLSFGIEKSATIDPAAFSPIPVTAPQISIVDGKLDILLPGQDDAAFFRLSGQ